MCHSNLSERNVIGSTSLPIHWEHHWKGKKSQNTWKSALWLFLLSPDHKVLLSGNRNRSYWQKGHCPWTVVGSAYYCVDSSSRNGRLWSLSTATRWVPPCLLSCREGRLLALSPFLEQFHTYNAAKEKALSVLQMWYQVVPKWVSWPQCCRERREGFLRLFSQCNPTFQCAFSCFWCECELVNFLWVSVHEVLITSNW